MSLNKFFCGFCLVTLVGPQQQSNATILHSATAALEMCIKDWFPQDIEFNESCVAEGCPDLNNIRLCSSDLDINSLRKITKILSNCMSGPICGIVIDPRPLRFMMISIDELLAGLEVKGIVTLEAGTGYLSNISNIQLDMTSNSNQHLPIQVAMSMPNIRFRGYYQMDCRLQTVFGPDLTARLTETTYDLGIQFYSVFSINQTGPHLHIDFVNPVIIASPQLCSVDLPIGFPNIQTLYTTSIQTLYENSNMATAIGRLIGKLYRGAIQVISRSCK